MANCTFFGHRDTPQEIGPILKSTLIDLIENKQVDTFLVGSQGNFDNIVRKCLRQLKLSYPHISYAVVLAYFPGEKKSLTAQEDAFETIYPEGMETSAPKYSIIKRNRWMIEKSDYVVTYVKHTIGGAAQFKALAEKKGKIVLNLAVSSP